MSKYKYDKLFSEYVEFYCPKCRKKFYTHPDKCRKHLSDCLKDLTFNQLIILREKTEDNIVKDGVELMMLYHHNSEKQ